MSAHYLALTWLLILTVTFFIYLISDGIALGVSTIMPWCSEKAQKKAINFLMPIWDANQTWLVFTLAGLYGGFSLGFSKLMAVLYLPLIVMFLSLICRGAAIEYASKTYNKNWLLALSISSVFIIFLQAYCIAMLIQAPWQSSTYKPQLSQYIFLVASMITLLLFDIQLGIEKLIPKRNHKRRIFIFLLFIISTIILSTLFIQLFVVDFKNFFLIINFFFVSLFCCFAILLERFHRNWFPIILIFSAFIATVLIFCYLFPNYFPGNLDYHNAASSNESLKFMIILSGIILPIIIITLTTFRKVFYSYFEE